MSVPAWVWGHERRLRHSLDIMQLKPDVTFDCYRPAAFDAAFYSLADGTDWTHYSDAIATCCGIVIP